MCGLAVSVEQWPLRAHCLLIEAGDALLMRADCLSGGFYRFAPAALRGLVACALFWGCHNGRSPPAQPNGRRGFTGEPRLL